MMKNVTIFTFDEMEEMRSIINNLIDNAADGKNEKYNPKHVCDWILKDLKELKELLNY